jgi:hypothetical protein
MAHRLSGLLQDPRATKYRLIFLWVAFQCLWLLVALAVYQRSSLFNQHAGEGSYPPGFSSSDTAAPGLSNCSSPNTTVGLAAADQHWLEQHVQHIVGSLHAQMAWGPDGTPDMDAAAGELPVTVPRPFDRSFTSTASDNIPGACCSFPGSRCPRDTVNCSCSTHIHQPTQAWKMCMLSCGSTRQI